MAGLDSLLEYNEIVRKVFGTVEEGFLFYVGEDGVARLKTLATAFENTSV